MDKYEKMEKVGERTYGKVYKAKEIKTGKLVALKKTKLDMVYEGIGRAFTAPVKTYTHEVVTFWYRAPEILLGTTQYTTAIDIWSVGCIFAEMVNMKVLFAGDEEIVQLHNIFRLLGTPTEQQWLGVTSLIKWHAFPNWVPQNLTNAFPSFSRQGVDLLTKMLMLNPAERISEKAALNHPYFDSLDNKILAESVVIVLVETSVSQ